MAFTIEQIDEKITQAQDAVKYWTQLRTLVSDPRFEALEDENEIQPTPKPLRPATSEAQTPATARPPYGQLKKLVIAHLARTGAGVTPQQLADIIAGTDYKFVTKTPAISVNDILQGLAAEKNPRAKIVGKVGLSNLWIRIGGD